MLCAVSRIYGNLCLRESWRLYSVRFGTDGQQLGGANDVQPVSVDANWDALVEQRTAYNIIRIVLFCVLSLRVG